MANLTAISTENLRKLIGSTEETLAELKDELDRREEQAQHDEIDNLEHHMQNAELSLQSIRDFFAMLVADL
ncbi:MAG: hypothetical protein AAFR17_19645, partial [Pseudomonadota bacterium]